MDARRLTDPLSLDITEAFSMTNRKRVLVVDDDDRVLFILSRAVARMGEGYEVLTAGDASDALTKIRKGDLHLLLTDIRLPGMNGVELTECVRAIDEDLAVIWMTAYGVDQLQHKARTLHVHTILDKPVSVARIRKAALEAMTVGENREREEHGRPSERDQ
jgi:DNA-binding NtrC family response regulator